MAVERNSIIRARLCFSALEQPITGRDGQGEPRYRATLCIDKNDKESMKALKMIAENAYKEGFGAEALKTKKEGWSGINDGDKRDKGPDGIHDGCFYVNAKAKNKPILIDEARQETTKIYDGCYVNAMLYAYTYEYMSLDLVALGANALVTSTLLPVSWPFSKKCSVMLSLERSNVPSSSDQ